MIYVIGERGTGVVKIGLARSPEARLRELQIGNPTRLSLQLSVPGDRSVERMLHDYFRDIQLGGEWFDFKEQDASRAVLSAIQEVPLPERAHPHRDLPTVSLADVLKAFGDRDRCTTRELLQALGANEWRCPTPQGGGRLLAAALRRHSVEPRIFWLDSRTQRGYERSDVVSALARADSVT